MGVKSQAGAVAGMLVVMASLVEPATVVRAAAPHDYAGHRHNLGSLTSALADDQVQPWLRQASGGRAIAHHAGGRRIKARKVISRAPMAEIHLMDVTAAEPTLGVDNEGNIFFVGLVDGGRGVLQAPVMKSGDGGRSFVEVSPRVGPERTHVSSQDPLLWVDKVTGRVFTADISLIAGCSTTISHSDDQGETWTTSQICTGMTDHQNMFTGPPVSSTTVGYPNIVYYCSIDGGALAGFGTLTSCAKSLDGGVTWVRTGAPPFNDDPTHTDPGHFGIQGHCGGETGHGFADSAGRIYVPRGWCGQPWLAISDDEGLTWTHVQVADNGVPGDEGPCAPLCIQEHEAGVTVDDSGNIFYMWTGRDRLPYLAVSRDEGVTWSEPMMIGPPGTKEAWGPAIDVGGDGKIAMTYMASRNAPGGDAPTGAGPGYAEVTWNAHITMTTDALAREPLFYTGQLNASRDPLITGSCGILRCQQEFDFIDVVIGPDGTPWSSLVDGCSPPPISDCSAVFGMGGVGHLRGGPSLL